MTRLAPRFAVISCLLVTAPPLLAQTDSTQRGGASTGAPAPPTEAITALRTVPPPKPRSSPMAIAYYKDATTYLKVVYGQPLRKGRQVWTELAPPGKLWRTGANEATEITLTRDVKILGKTLRAGTYALFTVPNATKWTVVFNTDLGQWGEYKYDDAKDVLQVEVPVQVNDEVYEAFTIRFLETTAGANLLLMWDATKVAIPLTFPR